MDKAFNFIKIIILITSLVYIFSFVISDESLSALVKEAGSKLTPYGIEILHLR